MSAMVKITFDPATARYVCTTTVYRDGDPVESVVMGERVGQWEAHTLIHNYVCTLLVGGGTATYDRTLDEYRVSVSNGSVEYVSARPKDSGSATSEADALDILSGVLGGEVSCMGGNTYALVFDVTREDQYLIAEDADSDERGKWIMAYERHDDDGQREWVDVPAAGLTPSRTEVEARKAAARANLPI